MQRTLILLKPDCLENKVAGQVIGRFEAKGYEIKASKMLQLDDALLREHYAHVADLPFFRNRFFYEFTTRACSHS